MIDTFHAASTPTMGPCLGKLKSKSSTSTPPPHPPRPASNIASRPAPNLQENVQQELVPLMASQPEHSELYAYGHLFSAPAAKPQQERQRLRSDQPDPIRFEHPPRCRCRSCRPTLYTPTWSVMAAWPDKCVAGCRCERCCFMREVEARQRRRLREER